MVICSIGNNFVPLAHHVGGEALGVRFYLLDVVSEFGGGRLLQLSGETCDLMVVGTALKHWEHTEIDGLGKFFFAENHS